ncbi:MAG: SURF1 family protein [Burkholderiales bacterium]
MRVAGYEFRPTLWPTLATLVMVVVTYNLGDWQIRRAAEKSTLQRHYDALAAEPYSALPIQVTNPERYRFRKVQVRGVFLSEHSIYLDNRIYQSRVGYQVVTPLRRVDSTDHVLIDRGWVAAPARRGELPAVRTPAGVVTIRGIATLPDSKVFELKVEKRPGKLWQNLSLERYRERVPFALQPWVVVQQNDTGDALIRNWERPDRGVDRHLGYAFQWYALTATLIVIYLFVNARKIH